MSEPTDPAMICGASGPGRLVCDLPAGHDGRHGADDQPTQFGASRCEWNTGRWDWNLDSLLDCVRDDLHPDQIRSLIREAYEAGQRQPAVKEQPS